MNPKIVLIILTMCIMITALGIGHQIVVTDLCLSYKYVLVCSDAIGGICAMYFCSRKTGGGP